MNEKFEIKLIPHKLLFSFQARTSRGKIPHNEVVYIKITERGTGNTGWGEINALKGLSLDADVDYSAIFSQIQKYCECVDISTPTTIIQSISKVVPQEYPALIMGMETAFLDLTSDNRRELFGFERREISINGLIWMGNSEVMLRQITEKIRDGFTCIKIKVGGLHFDDEKDILDYVRRKYYKDNITLRLDANGAFTEGNVLGRLYELSEFGIHSIEQPLPPGSGILSKIIEESPVPVALDEELIGKNTIEEKEALLEKLKPHFLVLKPSIHGGFKGTSDWIELAESQKIGWWITSALESNIGLNAITSFLCGFNNSLYQGLGTGNIYENNIPSPLYQRGGMVGYSDKKEWDLTQFEDV